MSKLIVANWKMNGSLKQISEDLLCYTANNITNTSSVVFALPNIYLSEAVAIKNKLSGKYVLASQDISQFGAKGAYTGEISAPMLKEFGIQYAIIGHSERRINLNESNDVLINKINNAIIEKITPIFCIGEPKNIRDANLGYWYRCSSN